MAALSASGSLVYATGSTERLLVRVDAGGAARPLDRLPAGEYATPRYAPDGTRVALTVTSAAGTEVRVLDLASGVLTPLVADGDRASPAWSPDGKRVVFAWTRGAARDLWWQAADGSDSAQLLVSDGSRIGSGVLSPDGRTVLYGSAPGPASRGRRGIPTGCVASGSRRR